MIVREGHLDGRARIGRRHSYRTGWDRKSGVRCSPTSAGTAYVIAEIVAQRSKHRVAVGTAPVGIQQRIPGAATGAIHSGRDNFTELCIVHVDPVGRSAERVGERRTGGSPATHTHAHAAAPGRGDSRRIVVARATGEHIVAVLGPERIRAIPLGHVGVIQSQFRGQVLRGLAVVEGDQEGAPIIAERRSVEALDRRRTGGADGIRGRESLCTRNSIPSNPYRGMKLTTSSYGIGAVDGRTAVQQDVGALHGDAREDGVRIDVEPARPCSARRYTPAASRSTASGCFPRPSPQRLMPVDRSPWIRPLWLLSSTSVKLSVVRGDVLDQEIRQRDGWILLELRLADGDHRRRRILNAQHSGTGDDDFPRGMLRPRPPGHSPI